MTDVWTAPSYVATGEANVTAYETEVLKNLRYLDQRDAARGIIAYQRETIFSPTYTASGNTDMVLGAVPLVLGRAYLVWLNTTVDFTGTGSWTVALSVNGVGVFRTAYFFVDSHANACLVYYPTSTGVWDFRVTVALQTGTSSLRLAASADVPRTFWIEDVGPQ